MSPLLDHDAPTGADERWMTSALQALQHRLDSSHHPVDGETTVEAPDDAGANDLLSTRFYRLGV